MSGEPEVTRTPEGDETEEEEIKTSYKPPPEKTIEEILAADQEDESLRKYKEALLGQAQAGAVIVGMYSKGSNTAMFWRQRAALALTSFLTNHLTVSLG